MIAALECIQRLVLQSKLKIDVTIDNAYDTQWNDQIFPLYSSKGTIHSVLLL